MKTKIVYLRIVLFAIAIVVGATSCGQQNACGCEDEAGNLTISLSFSPLHTRALPAEPGDQDGTFNENKVGKLDVFVYQGTTLKWRIGGSGLTYDAGTQKVTLPVTAEKRALFNGATSYDIYVVANNTADLTSIVENADNLSALQNLVFQSPGFVSNGGSAAQSSFVMDGKITQSISLDSPDLGTVSLKRSASKIRLLLVEVNILNYLQEGTATARLAHFTDRSALMEGGTAFAPGSDDWKDTGKQDLSAGTAGQTTAAPFYAYSHDWSSSAAEETYLELFIPLKDNNGVTETYQYRIPLTPSNLTGDEAQYMHKLQRNLLYDISVTVKILGSKTDPPAEVTGNYTIKDWTTQEVLVDIKGSHYLVVSETNVTMPNVNTYTLNFNSSIPNVTLVEGSLKASYTYVDNSTGLPIVTTISSGNSQYPSVTVQPNVAAGTIAITSAIPVNYIPKDIEFQVTNGTLTEKVVLRQLPGTYFTTTQGVSSARYSDFQKVVDAGLNNPYMYAITTLAPAGDVIWGFPPVDSQGRTIDSKEVANMISPRFEMASQFGASERKSYVAGQTQCQEYWEKAADGTKKEGWRLPTEAEIRYIDNLQHNSNNPVGAVMTGRWYWDSYSYNNAYQMSGGTSGSSTSAHVRCIRDIKD